MSEIEIWTIILAAGEASRFGGPKALATWEENQTLLEHAISIAPQSKNVVVVTGAHHDVIAPTLYHISNVYNEDWQQGMGSSIACGIKYAAQKSASVAIILPVDQPLITKDYLNRMVRLCGEHKKCILTQDRDVTGPPACVPSAYFTELISLKKDGLKKYLTNYEVCNGIGLMDDVDTKQDLQSLIQTGKKADTKQDHQT